MVAVLLLSLALLPWVGAELLARNRPEAVALTPHNWISTPPAQRRHTPPDPESWWYEQPARRVATVPRPRVSGRPAGRTLTRRPARAPGAPFERQLSGPAR